MAAKMGNEKWRDSLIKSKDIKWQRNVKAKNVEDNKLDINIFLPLTTIFEGQARQSYLCGVVDTLAFLSDSKTTVTKQSIVDFLTESGYEKEAAAFLARKGE